MPTSLSPDLVTQPHWVNFCSPLPSLFADHICSGSFGSKSWSDIWDAIGPLCHRCLKGETISEYDAPLSFYRQDRGEKRLMEEYHCYAFVPVNNEEGVFCLHNPSFESVQPFFLWEPR